MAEEAVPHSGDTQGRCRDEQAVREFQVAGSLQGIIFQLF